MRNILIAIVIFCWGGINQAAFGETLLEELAFAPPTPSVIDVATLEQGEPIVVVTKDDSRVGAAGAVRAAIDVAATRETLWNLMIDCDAAPSFVKGLKKCNVLDKDVNGKWDVRRHEISWSWLAPKVENIFRSEYEYPATIAFQRIDGDLRVLEGVWRLQKLEEGRTRLWYQSRIATGAPVPKFLVRRAVRKDTKAILFAVKARAEAMQSAVSE